MRKTRVGISAAVGGAALALGAFAGIGTAMATPDEDTVVTQPGTEAPASSEQAGTEAPPTTVQPGTEAPAEPPAQPEPSVQPGTEPSETQTPSQQEETEAPEATEQPGTQAPVAPQEQEPSAPEATEQAGTEAPAQPREESTSAPSQAPASAEPVETAPDPAQPVSQTPAASEQQSTGQVQATPLATEADQIEAPSEEAVEESDDQGKSTEHEPRGVTGSLDAQAPVIAGRAELTGYEDGFVQANLDGSIADTQITVVASQQIIPEPVHKAQQAAGAAQQQVNEAADSAVRDAVGDERVDQAAEISEQVQQHYGQAVAAVHEAVQEPVIATVDAGEVTVTAEVAQAEPLENQEEIAPQATVATEAVQVDLAEDTVTVQNPDADQANI